jgi:DNA repair protein RadC
MAAGSGATVEAVQAALQSFCEADAEGGVCARIPRCGECPIGRYCDEPRRRPTIKDMPASSRPRERLLQDGQEALSDVELLAIVIRGGSSRATALDLASDLLNTFVDFRTLADCSPGELTRVHGIGPAKAAQIKAAMEIARRYAADRIKPGKPITGSKQLFEHMRERVSGLKKEVFYTILLDTKHCIIREDRVAVGSLSESVVHPREVFKQAIRESAAKVIFAHNHPSGNPDPSPQDRALTRRLTEAGTVIGIEVLDHVILGRDTYFSFAEHGLLGG